MLDLIIKLRLKNEVQLTFAVCPQNFTYLPRYKKCYKLEVGSWSFDLSMNRCNSLHPLSHAVVVNDISETSALIDYFTSTNSK